jgi:hypothetical protein
LTKAEKYVIIIIENEREVKNMQITIIEYNGTERQINCESFEFRTNQVTNCLKVYKEHGIFEEIHEVATIKGQKER